MERDIIKGVYNCKEKPLLIIIKNHEKW